MRYAILADIHSNLAALTAVLEDIEGKGGVDEMWCLGDIVGYGPEPGECIALLRKYDVVCIAGNHDLGSVGKPDPSFFNSRFCLVGHTHVPMAFKQDGKSCTSIPMSLGIGLVLGHRMIINPGAVGQPRDGDPSASYAIYQSEGHMLRVYRIPYDVRATQDRMMQAGLPISLVTRLEVGR